MNMIELSKQLDNSNYLKQKASNQIMDFGFGTPVIKEKKYIVKTPELMIYRILNRSII